MNGGIMSLALTLKSDLSVPLMVIEDSSPVDEVANLPEKCTKADLQLLARLEMQNRLLETDAKSLSSLTSGHSRKSSCTSLVSVTSGTSQQSAVGDEEGDLWQTWGCIVNDWETYAKKKNSYLKEMVHKGIPHHFRGMVWQLLCNAQNCQARENYTEFLKSTSPCEKVILRDIARTYPEHEFFRDKDGPGQEGLFSIMKAYSLQDREVGYCQGSAFIVGLLLLQMPEEDAFCVLVRLMEDYRLREMYKPSMAELGLCMYQLECIVQEQLPELHVHFQSQSFHTSMYASSWFLTLFTSCLPLPLACRVMDLFLSENMEMIFRIAVAILQYCKDDLLQQDMEGMLRYFQKEMPVKCETDPDHLFNFAFQVKYSSKKMKKMEKEYMAIKAKEQEEMIELRRLRTENRILRQRIEHLEQESLALADRLVQGQVIRAQEAEDSYSIKRELASLRQHEQDTQKQLERAHHTIKELHEANSQSNSLDTETEDLIRSMQSELISVKLREAENHESMLELQLKIQELEEANKCLRETIPSCSIAHLQEELIAAKLREAEANLSMKELCQKVGELQAMWDKHLNASQASPSTPSRRENKAVVVQLQEEIMSAKLNEAEAVAELKELQQKLLELETKNQISSNHIRRQAEEMEKLEQQLKEMHEKTKSLSTQLAGERRKYTEIENKTKEHQLVLRLKEAEQEKVIAEFRNKIASLELKNKELSIKGPMNSVNSEENEMKALKEKVSSLQTKVLQQTELNQRLALTLDSLGSDNNHNSSSQSSYGHFNGLMGELGLSRSNSNLEDNNYEQLYQLQFDPQSPTSEGDQLKNKVNGEL